MDLGRGDGDAVHQQAVTVGGQFQVVADVHRRDQESQVLGQLATHRLDARHQFAALVLVDQRNQPVAHFQAQRIDRAQFVPGQFRVAVRCAGGGQGRDIAGGGFGPLLRALPHLPGQVAQDRGQRQKGDVGHARHQADQAQHARGHRQRLVLAEGLTHHGLAHVLRTGGAGDQHGHGGGHQQRRQLRHQAVADGQQGVGGRGLGRRHAVLGHAHGEPADQVDEQDQDAGDGVAADELVGTVHRTVEVGFLADFLAARLGFLAGQDAGVEIGVDGHLLARHRVQDEARRHLGNTARALGDHHEVDDGQDGEHHDADRVVAAHHELAEGRDDLAGGVMAVLAVEQDHAGGGHVQRQAQHRGHQQDDGEDGEVQRPLHVDHGQQHHQRDGDVEAEQRVQDRRRQRHHDHGQQRQHHQRRAQAVLQHLHPAHAAGGRLRAHALPPCSSTSTAGMSGCGASPTRQARSWYT